MNNDKRKTSSLWIGNFSELKLSDFGTPGFHGRYHPKIPYQMMSLLNDKQLLKSNTRGNYHENCNR